MPALVDAVRVSFLLNQCQSGCQDAKPDDRLLQPFKSPLLQVGVEVVIGEAFPGLHQHVIAAKCADEQTLRAPHRVT